MHAALRGALWAGSAAALLLVGLLGILLLVYAAGILTGRITAERQRDVQLVMTLYFRVIALKGLLPQLLVSLALWPLLARLWPAVTRSRRGLMVGLLLAATLAHAVVGPLLLGSSFGSWPALERVGLYQNAMTYALMTAGVVLAALLPRIWIRPLRLAG